MRTNTVSPCFQLHFLLVAVVVVVVVVPEVCVYIFRLGMHKGRHWLVEKQPAVFQEPVRHL